MIKDLINSTKFALFIDLLFKWQKRYNMWKKLQDNIQYCQFFDSIVVTFHLLMCMAVSLIPSAHMYEFFSHSICSSVSSFFSFNLLMCVEFFLIPSAHLYEVFFLIPSTNVLGFFCLACDGSPGLFIFSLH